MNKSCSKCGENKDVSFFYIKNKEFNVYRSRCKECESKYRVKYKPIRTDKSREYDNNRRRDSYDEEAKLKKKNYRDNNKKKISDYQKEYIKDNKEKRSKQRKNYYKENKVKVKAQKKLWTTNKMKTDPLYKLKVTIRNNISETFKRKGYSKNSHTEEILGCSFNDLKLYLESMFKPWMTWKNKGLYNGELDYGWDIDHIIPVSSAITVDELIKFNHYTNLQPLCGYYNRHIKFNNYE